MATSLLDYDCEPETSSGLRKVEENCCGNEMDDAVQVFARLYIDRQDEMVKEGEMKKGETTKVQPATYSRAQAEERLRRRHRIRWSPYHVRSRSVPSRSRKEAELYKSMYRVRLTEEVDVDELRYRLLDKKSTATSCSIEANKPPQPDLEVDELAEYFNCFVNVKLKMSALAESMYV